MFLKDGLPKKFEPEHDVFCNICKDGISFFQKIWYFFFRRKMKEDNLYQKTRGNMIFYVYMRRRYKRDISLLAKKTKMPRKNTPKGDISSITERDYIHSRFILFLLKYHTHLQPSKGPKKQPPEMFYRKRCS